MFACKYCKYSDEFTRLRIYCTVCLEKLNDKFSHDHNHIIPGYDFYANPYKKILKEKVKKKKIEHVEDLPLLNTEFNYLTDLMNSSKNDYSTISKEICDRIYTAGIIHYMSGPDSKQFKMYVLDLKKSIISLCAEILCA